MRSIPRGGIFLEHTVFVHNFIHPAPPVTAESREVLLRETDQLPQADFQIQLGNTSALDDGLEPFGFQVLARIRCGLIVLIRPDLNAVVLVRVGGMTNAGNFFC
jgi:hypothetical protein